MKKIKTKIIACTLGVILFFIPLSPFDKTAFSQQVDITEINDYQEWDGDRIISGNIQINPEGTLVIHSGVTITFEGEWPGIEVSGKLIIKGTVVDPVKIRKSESAEGYSIVAFEDGKVAVRNVDVSGGGLASGILLKKDTNYWNKAYAFNEYQGAFHAMGGVVDIEGGNFHDNFVAVGGDYGSIKVNRSKFSQNEMPVFEFHQTVGPSLSKADFQYNWWGDAAGPKKCNPRVGCHENEIRGSINFSNWAAEENFHDPVIIIPGILGSQKVFGEWKVDPIFRTYDGLYKNFKENGYTADKDLFEFPYEWRDSNTENAKLLKDRVSEIKQKIHWSRVDLVVHSMGGLLAREYIESDFYQDDIDQLITLGTPHNGAPNDYLAWEGGKVAESQFDIFGKLSEKIFQLEAKEKGYSSVFDYIRQRPIKSVQELLPVYDYLYSVSDDEMRKYPSFYPANPFLENLNKGENISKLDAVEFHNIVGELGGGSTITKIRVEKPSLKPDSLWGHGRPENYDSLFGDHGLEKGKGDGTVPLVSATGILYDGQINMEAAHRELPSKASDYVYEILTGKKPEHKVDYEKIKKILIFLVFSPIDIQITSPDGKRAGKNFQTGEIFNEIKDAYYTGYDTDTEFLTIPNPENGDYKVLTQGTGSGEYKIEAVKISEDPENPEEATEIIGTLRGISEIGREQESIIEVRDTEIITEERDTVKPNIEIISPEEKEYLNDQNIDIKYRVEDNMTAPEKIKTVLFLDEKEIQSGNIDLSLESPGTRVLKISATDEAGNENQEEVFFTNIASLDSIKNNVARYFDLKLISKKHEERYLQAYLRAIQRVAQIEEKINKNTHLTIDARERIIKKIHQTVDRNIAMLIAKLKKPGEFKSMDAKAKTLLIESLEYIRQLLA